ncbi:MAG: XRE family transcriptional regulator [Clostridiales bacterium]|nr:XRE family transcriptional regulator [Clostridiales bacterium]
MGTVREHLQHNLNYYLKENKMTQKKLSELLNVSQAAVTNWTKGKNSPDIETLIQICNILNISINDILDVDVSDADSELSKTERTYIQKYIALDNNGKSLVHLIIDNETQRMRSQAAQTVSAEAETQDLPDEDNIISIVFYDLPVSAGTGIYLNDSYKDEIEVERNAITERADFALRINGDSMEPRYHNGDVLLVREQSAVEQGECGIFILNGEGYFKKLGRNQLISLNPKYRPIPIHEYDTVSCVGKVLGTL